MKGRGPNTAKFRLITGNRSRRPAKTKPIALQSGVPEMPEYLNAKAQLIWPKFITDMQKRKILTPEDGAALAELCQAWAEVRTLEDDVGKNGRFQRVETSTGDTKRAINPNWPALLGARKHLEKWLEQCGLTNLTRSRVQPIEEKKDDKDPAAEFFE